LLSLLVEFEQQIRLKSRIRLLTVAEPSAPSGRFSEAEQAKRGRFRKPLQRRRETPFAQAAGREVRVQQGEPAKYSRNDTIRGYFFYAKSPNLGLFLLSLFI
jgi:hypothetical protein